MFSKNFLIFSFIFLSINLSANFSLADVLFSRVISEKSSGLQIPNVTEHDINYSNIADNRDVFLYPRDWLPKYKSFLNALFSSSSNQQFILLKDHSRAIDKGIEGRKTDINIDYSESEQINIKFSDINNREHNLIAHSNSFKIDFIPKTDSHDPHEGFFELTFPVKDKNNAGETSDPSDWELSSIGEITFRMNYKNPNEIEIKVILDEGPEEEFRFFSTES